MIVPLWTSVDCDSREEIEFGVSRYLHAEEIESGMKMSSRRTVWLCRSHWVKVSFRFPVFFEVLGTRGAAAGLDVLGCQQRNENCTMRLAILLALLVTLHW